MKSDIFVKGGQHFKKSLGASALENKKEVEILNEEVAEKCNTPKITRQLPLDHATELWLNKLRHVFGLCKYYVIYIALRNTDISFCYKN